MLFELIHEHSGEVIDDCDAENLWDACITFGFCTEDIDIEGESALCWVRGEHMYTVYESEES